MLIFLNPFTWGMRRKPHYEPSSKTILLLSDLNKKYEMDVNIGEVIDTLWYFRDLKNGKISKLETFELNLENDNQKKMNLYNVENYLKEFRKRFEHKKYFDSIKVSIDYDSIIYKSKM